MKLEMIAKMLLLEILRIKILLKTTTFRVDSGFIQRNLSIDMSKFVHVAAMQSDSLFNSERK